MNALPEPLATLIRDRDLIIDCFCLAAVKIEIADERIAALEPLCDPAEREALWTAIRHGDELIDAAFGDEPVSAYAVESDEREDAR